MVYATPAVTATRHLGHANPISAQGLELTGFKVVLFDFDNTLAHSFPARFEAVRNAGELLESAEDRALLDRLVFIVS